MGGQGRASTLFTLYIPLYMDMGGIYGVYMGYIEDMEAI